MLSENLVKEYGWAIDAFRRTFGYENVTINIPHRSRHLSVTVNDKTFVLYKAETTGEYFSLNSHPNRWGALETMLEDARG